MSTNKLNQLAIASASNAAILSSLRIGANRALDENAPKASDLLKETSLASLVLQVNHTEDIGRNAWVKQVPRTKEQAMALLSEIGDEPTPEDIRNAKLQFHVVLCSEIEIKATKTPIQGGDRDGELNQSVTATCRGYILDEAGEPINDLVHLGTVSCQYEQLRADGDGRKVMRVRAMTDNRKDMGAGFILRKQDTSTMLNQPTTERYELDPSYVSGLEGFLQKLQQTTVLKPDANPDLTKVFSYLPSSLTLQAKKTQLNSLNTVNPEAEADPNAPSAPQDEPTPEFKD